MSFNLCHCFNNYIFLLRMKKGKRNKQSYSNVEENTFSKNFLPVNHSARFLYTKGVVAFQKGKGKKL